MALEDYLALTSHTAQKVQALTGEGPKPQTLVGKVIQGGLNALGYLSDQTQRHITLPIAEQLNAGDPLVSARLKALEGPSPHPLQLSDVLQSSGVYDEDPNDNEVQKVGRAFLGSFPGRLATDIAGDPLSYVNLGASTRLGKVAAKVASQKAAGETIALGSKLAQDAADVLGKPASAQLIKDVPKSLEGLPLADQIAGKQRSLISVWIPGKGDVAIPLIGTGPLAEAASKPFTAISRTKLAERFTQATRDLFSTKTNNPEFDTLVSNFKDLAMHRAGEKILQAKELDSKLGDLADKLGMSREEINQTVTGLVEKETAGIVGRPITKVAQALNTSIGKAGKKLKFARDIPGVGDVPNIPNPQDYGWDPDNVTGETSWGKTQPDGIHSQFNSLAAMKDFYGENANDLQWITKSHVETPEGYQYMKDPANGKMLLVSDGTSPTHGPIPSISKEDAVNLYYGLPDIEKMVTQPEMSQEILTHMSKQTNLPEDTVKNIAIEAGIKYKKLVDAGFNMNNLNEDDFIHSLGIVNVSDHEPHLPIPEVPKAPKTGQYLKTQYGNIDEPGMQGFTPVDRSEIPTDHYGSLINKGEIHYSKPDEPIYYLDKEGNAWKRPTRLNFDLTNPEILQKVEKLGINKMTEGFSYGRAASVNDELLTHVAKMEKAIEGKEVPYSVHDIYTPEGKKLLNSWQHSIDETALNKLLENQAKNPEGLQKVQEVLNQTGAPEEIPVFIGRTEAKVSPDERPYSYASIYPWTADTFAKKKSYAGGRVYTYLVPKQDVLGWAGNSKYSEGEIFFKTQNIKKAFEGDKPIAPLFAKAGEIPWLNPNTPTELLQKVLDWIDNKTLLGVTKEEGEKAQLKPWIRRLQTWLRSTIADKEGVAKLPENAKDAYVSVASKVSQEDPELVKLAQEIGESQLRQLQDEQISGVQIIPMVADREYAPHIVTPEAQDLIREAAITKGQLPRTGVTKEMSTKLINTARREFTQINPTVISQWLKDDVITLKKANALKGKNGLEHLDQLLDDGKITENMYSQAIHTLSVDEVNKIASTEGLSVLGIKDYKVDANGNRVPIYNTVPQYFHTDPAYYSAVRGVRGERARTSTEFYQEIINRGIAVKADKAPANYLPVPQPELEGYKFEPDVAKAMANWYSFVRDPRETNAFLKLYDTVQNAWKAWTLAIFPAYHSRNLVGNLWNNFLAGVMNPADYIAAKMVQWGGHVSFVDGAGQKWETKALQEEAKKLGVIDRGWVGADIAQSLEDQLSKGNLLELGKKNWFVKKGMELGKHIENNARMAHFIAKLKEGYSSEAAAMSVKKYLFDYGDLTNFEKSVMKRAFPFYSWTRKNIPLQLTHLITNPGKFAVIQKGQREIERPNDDYRITQLPQWMMENYPTKIRYNKKDKTFTYFLLGSWLPAADITKLFQLHEVAANMLSPIPKEVIQQMFNYDFFTKQKIEDIPGQKTRFIGMDLPNRVVHGAKVIRLLNEVDKATADDKTIMEKIEALATGKTYKVDPQNVYIQSRLELRDKINTLKKQLYKEARKNPQDPKEMERIIGLMQQTVKDYN